MANALIFIYLAIFPFGQIFKLVISIQPLDIISGAILGYVIIRGHKWNKYIIYFLISALFSYLLFAFLHPSTLLFTGLLYLLRLTAGLSFIPFIQNNFRTEKAKFNLLNCLLAAIVIVGVFGWVQYFLLPDFRPFKILGWDDHLFRLLGTFLDPTFIGLILVFGCLIALVRKSFWLVLFFLLTLAFTYSRASYLALAMSLMVYGVWQRKFWLSGILVSLFAVIIILLPRPSSEGTQLERTQSIFGRFHSYAEGLVVLKQNPLFGVGFDNYCYARQIYLKTNDSESHACGGTDSSLLNILITTGVVGFVLFINEILSLRKFVAKNSYGVIFTLCSVALFIHSFFSNSLFYPWVLGLMAILGGLAIQSNAE